MSLPEPAKDIVLIGGGHAHVLTLKSFVLDPEPRARLTLIAKELMAPYSGMIPGFVAGHYGLADCHIDVSRLARSAGARVIHGAVCGIDRLKRNVIIDGEREPVPFNLLSIDTGITPNHSDIEGAAEHAIAVKPISHFAPKWQALERQIFEPGGPRRITVIGGGAAGVELVLAVRYRVMTLLKERGLSTQGLQFTLLAGGKVLPSHNGRARQLATQELARQTINVIENDPAVRIGRDGIGLQSGRQIASDANIISTKAAPPSWLAATGLALDRGFLAVHPTLQVLNDDDIFAAGDCANVLEHPREKAGVFAVRQGPVVAANLRRRLNGDQPAQFVPQKEFLSLMSLGQKRAIASRGRFAVAGRWAWVWKDRIDRAFMDQFKSL